MSLTQANRTLAIKTPLGDDALLMVSFAYFDQVGRPFHADIGVQSDDPNLDFNSILGQNVTVRLSLPGGGTRYFNGYVNRIEQEATAGQVASYQATLVPWLWFLTRTADCRIFQNMTVPDIVKKVFRDAGFTDFTDKLTGSYNPCEYCVQYRETDFNFVSRLMEHEGIYYFFTHDNGKHTLVMADSPGAHEPVQGYEQLEYRPKAEADSSGEDITHLAKCKDVQSGVYAYNDFDFTSPKKSLLVNASSSESYPNADFPIFDYPGGYTQFQAGSGYAKLRMEELAAQAELSGQSDARGIAAGFTFELKDAPRADMGKKYLVLSVEIRVSNDVYQAGHGQAANLFSCSFTALDASVQYRPPRITPKPIVRGPQTAIVVGQAGDEITTDQYGRVKLQFHWDRYGKSDENSSCWIRVAQIWAGNKWGGMFIPRIGQEVIVDFLEGDPDRPIVTGRVYNGDNGTPYPLPNNATMSTVKSYSSKGGDGFNEIRFEDKKGQEQLFIHGEKNQDIRIKNDCFEWIGHDRHLVVKNEQFEHIELDRNETIDRDHVEQIGRDRNTTIQGKEAKEVTGSLSLKVTGDVAEVFGSNHSEQVSSDYYVKADNIVIEGMSSITIKVGETYIAIDATGIKMSAPATFEVEAMATATIKGDAMLTLKGGMVMIN
ncbi:MAG: type VI secretion system tip protein VgrG [Tepidisphaeraceae bacterium]|jgi:type VI secretion system secreted protein VgrG